MLFISDVSFPNLMGSYVALRLVISFTFWGFLVSPSRAQDRFLSRFLVYFWFPFLELKLCRAK